MGEIQLRLPNLRVRIFGAIYNLLLFGLSVKQWGFCGLLYLLHKAWGN